MNKSMITHSALLLVTQIKKTHTQIHLNCKNVSRNDKNKYECKLEEKNLNVDKKMKSEPKLGTSKRIMSISKITGC